MDLNKDEIRILNALLFHFPANTLEDFSISEVANRVIPHQDRQPSGIEILAGNDNISSTELETISLKLHQELMQNGFVVFARQASIFSRQRPTSVAHLTEKGIALKQAGSYEAYLSPDKETGIELIFGAPNDAIMSTNEFLLLELIYKKGEKHENEFRSLFRPKNYPPHEFDNCRNKLCDAVLVDRELTNDGFTLKINQNGIAAYERENNKCSKYGISCSAKYVIEAMLADRKNLNSESIYLGDYSLDNDTLDDALHFLSDNGFARRVAPHSEADKYLISYELLGRQLHRAGSIEEFFQSKQKLELQPAVTHTSIVIGGNVTMSGGQLGHFEDSPILAPANKSEGIEDIVKAPVSKQQAKPSLFKKFAKWCTGNIGKILIAVAGGIALAILKSWLGLK